MSEGLLSKSLVLVLSLFCLSEVSADDRNNNRFDGSEGGYISMQQAKAWIENYHQSKPFDQYIESYFYGEKLLIELLSKPNAMGIRFYNGVNEQKAPVIMLTAVDQFMHDIVSSVGTDKTLEGSALEADIDDIGDIADFGHPCPPRCGPTSLAPVVSQNAFIYNTEPMTGLEGGYLFINQAQRWIDNYLKAKPFDQYVESIFYGEEIIMDLLSKPGAKGIRVYFGLKHEGELVFVLVATNQLGEDIIAVSNSDMGDRGNPLDDDVVDDGIPCPPGCD